MNPMAPNASSTRSTIQMKGLARSPQSRVEMVIAARMRIPPIVGVPALPMWLLGPSSRMYWPT